jgi:sulfoxide reductase heme-binding subunit YedZ
MDQVNALARKLPTSMIYLLGALPFALLVYSALSNTLGPDPVKALELQLGTWGLRFLIASLAITPLMGLGIRLLKFRRALGLLGFFYVALHFTTWMVLDLALRWGQIGSELYKRPFIIIGFAAFLLLVPLALTSWNGAIRRMGAATWKKLHKLAYAAILLGGVHFVMIGKVYTAEALIHLAIVIGLLGLRLLPARVKARKTV